MKLYQLLFRQEPTIAVEVDRGLVNFTAALQTYYFMKKKRFLTRVRSMQELFTFPEYSEEFLLRVFDFLETHNFWDQYLIKSDYKIQAPISRPGKIIALGLNYKAHAEESGVEVPEEPVFFAKAGSIVVGQDDPIVIPSDVGRVDHEIELAVIIGRTAKAVVAEEAHEYIAGYTILNDITARDLQRQDKEARRPWFRSKNFDTFAPMGPCLVTGREFSDPIQLDMELRVNGIARQKSNTAKMIFSIPQLLARITRYLTLFPGDVISTGTPEGIAELRDGDMIEAEIAEIGVLRNRVLVKKTPSQSG